MTFTRWTSAQDEGKKKAETNKAGYSADTSPGDWAGEAMQELLAIQKR